MSVLIVKAFNKEVDRILRHWFTGNARKELKKYFLRKLASGIYLLDANGELLSFLWGLKRRYENDIDIWVGTRLQEWFLPEEVKEVSKWLEEKPKSTNFQKANLPTRKTLKKIWLDCSVISKVR